MIESLGHEPPEDEPVKPSGLSPILERLGRHEEIQAAGKLLLDSIVRTTLAELISTPVENRHIYFMGSGPYEPRRLEEWVERLGGFATDEKLDSTMADWFVVGRRGFDRDLLDTLVSCKDVTFFSQESFLCLVLFGEEATKRQFHDGNDEPHAGLDWVFYCFEVLKEYSTHPEALSIEVIGYAKPAVSLPNASPPEGLSLIKPAPPLADPLSPTDAGGELFDGPVVLRLESELAKLGYSVAKGVSISQRQMALDEGVRSLGLRKVSFHLAWLIRFHRNTPSKQSAVERWQEDFGEIGVSSFRACGQ